MQNAPSSNTTTLKAIKLNLQSTLARVKALLNTLVNQSAIFENAAKKGAGNTDYSSAALQHEGYLQFDDKFAVPSNPVTFLNF